ncbi:hypothetical protein [Ralstonia mannitolilytica]|uniref:hypothetical protein n=1 Tax=Ralstonia mannitolilytica TaxID=105219 RepID=UPI000CEE2C9A|nr:hypothetical protein [Ralstonia mannitolilytica]
MSEIKTNKQRVIELIMARPGIRTPEIAEELEIGNPQSCITGELDRGEILAEKVQPEYGGHTVNAYRINPDNPPDLTLQPRQRVVKAVGARSTGGAGNYSFALSSSGDLTINDGRKAIHLPPAGTTQLIAYLDRINVDQVMKAAGVI